jgi:hypothetical protein
VEEDLFFLVLAKAATAISVKHRMFMRIPDTWCTMVYYSILEARSGRKLAASARIS